MSEMTQTPSTSVSYLENLIGAQVTVRTKAARTWGPYKLVAVYPDGPLPAIVLEGSREYLIPLDQIAVFHEGAKPTQQEHYARKHGLAYDPSKPDGGVSFPGINLDEADDEADED